MTQKLKKMTTSIIFHTLGFLCYVETNVSEEAKNTNQIWSSNRLRDFRWMPKDKIQIRLFCPFLLSLRVIKYSLLHVNLHFKESGTDFLNFLVNTFLCVSLSFTPGRILGRCIEWNCHDRFMISIIFSVYSSASPQFRVLTVNCINKERKFCVFVSDWPDVGGPLDSTAN